MSTQRHQTSRLAVIGSSKFAPTEKQVCQFRAIIHELAFNPKFCVLLGNCRVGADSFVKTYNPVSHESHVGVRLALGIRIFPVSRTRFGENAYWLRDARMMEKATHIMFLEKGPRMDRLKAQAETSGMTIYDLT